MAKKTKATKDSQATHTVTCNACPFSATAVSEAQGDVIAARHASDVHRDSASHHLGVHIFVKPIQS